MKALWINAEFQDIRSVDVNGLEDVRHFVGGAIECAWVSPYQDTLYVREDGWVRNRPNYFFRIAGIDQPLCGNGLLVGREDPLTEEEFNVEMTVPEMLAIVRWMDKSQVESWIRAHASEPMIELIGGDSHLVISRWGELSDRSTREERITYIKKEALSSTDHIERRLVKVMFRLGEHDDTMKLVSVVIRGIRERKTLREILDDLH